MSVTPETRHLMLVGSLPFADAESTFRWARDAKLADELLFLPDGEPGERAYWITGQGYRTFNGHPDIETVGRPDRINGVENWRPQRASEDQWSFRVKEHVEHVQFGDAGWRLGYARDAINSYFVFKTLKSAGAIPRDLRFQVCLPMPLSTCLVMFRSNQNDLKKIVPGFAEALAAEIKRIVEFIPASELAIQFDSTAEAQALTDATAAEMTLGTIDVLFQAVLPEALLGVHFCHGSLPPNTFFMRRPSDLSVLVNAMNIISSSTRRVDYIHFPILDHQDSSYYAPLEKLHFTGPRWYLGVIHGMGDLVDFKQRLSFARRFIPEFGIAAPCGFGRFDFDRLQRIAEEHLLALKIFNDFC